MQEILECAKEQSRNFYLTLVSMISSLALGYLLASLRPSGSPLDRAACVYWLQALAVFQCAVLTWHEYAIGTVFFRWATNYVDSLIPFLFGIAEFALVEAMNKADLSVWFRWLAAIPVLSVLAYLNQYLKARRHKENVDALKRVADYRIAETGLLISGSVFFYAFSANLTRSGAVATYALPFALAVNVLLIVYTVLTNIAYHRVIHGPDARLARGAPSSP